MDLLDSPAWLMGQQLRSAGAADGKVSAELSARKSELESMLKQVSRDKHQAPHALCAAKVFGQAAPAHLHGCQHLNPWTAGMQPVATSQQMGHSLASHAIQACRTDDHAAWTGHVALNLCR